VETISLDLMFEQSLVQWIHLVPEVQVSMHEVPIEDSIDLHTFQPRDVRSVVEEYLFQAVRQGFGEVRIIHGRGIGVQRETVRSVLEKDPDVIEYWDLPDRGSTVARLRQKP
jgi:DNA-nicking Smr family endonuclease